MSVVLRAALFASVIAVVVLGWLWIDSGKTPPPNTAAATMDRVRRWQSSQECRSCHEKQYAEWAGSHHQIAYTNPEVRRLSDNFRVKDCQACHLPRPVAQTGWEKRTLPRQTRPLEGVDCLTCHLGADGGILSTRSNSAAPCRPRAEEGFASERLCASCHNQHTTTDQWRASPFAKDGKSCNDCHMPDGSHAFPGAHDETMLKKAGKLLASAANGELRMTLRNTGAGHNLPTEERHRAVDIVYRFEMTSGDVTEWRRAWRCRQPYRDEVGEDTQLPAGAEKTVAVVIPDDAAKAHVRLWYRLNPYAKDGDAASTLLDETEVTLR